MREIDKFTNEHDRAYFIRAYEAMRMLMDATAGPNRYAVVYGLWTAFRNAHRTNQQSFIRAVVEMLRVFANNKQKQVCDARNKASYEFANSISAQDIFFPYI